MAPDEHAGNQRRADEHRHVAAVEKLEEVGGQEGDVEGKEEGEQPEARPLRPAPVVADDEVIEDRGHGHRASNSDAVGRSEPDTLAEGEHERQAADGQQRVDLGDVDLPFVVAGGVADRHPREEALEHRLPRQREGAGDQRLRSDDGGKARKKDQRPRGRPGGHHPEKGLGGSRGIAEDQRPLPQVGKDERRQDEHAPGEADGLEPEVAHVGIEGLATGDDEDNRSEDVDPAEAVPQKELDAPPGGESPDDLRLQHDLP